jgi:arylsulfatase A-like enzyme
MSSNRRDFLKTTGTAASAIAAGLPLSPQETYAQQNGKRPNILFFFPDQHRYDWVGTNSTIPVPTPHFYKLAKNGVLFQNAYCPSPLCAPSRACLASGKEYHRARVKDNSIDYPLDQRTFYTMLRDSGYHVMGCGKIDLHKRSEIWGIDGKTLTREWGFSDAIDNAGKWDAVRSGKDTPKDPYMYYLHDKDLVQVHIEDMEKRRGKNAKATHATELPDHAYCDNWIAEHGLRLIRNSPDDKPWFIQINFTGPHDPLDITYNMENKCRGIDYPQPNRSTQFDAKTHNAIRQNYSAMVTNIDRWLGVFIDELKKRGEYENTIIVYSSDHGEMLGDHDLWAKTKPHQPSVGVPLAISGPGIQAGVDTNALVSLIDLTATYLDYAGLDVPNDMDGKSLRNVLTGKTSTHRDVLYSALWDWRCAYDGQYKLVEGYYPGDEPWLFDIGEDPKENVNIAGKAPNHVKKLQDALQSMRT